MRTSAAKLRMRLATWTRRAVLCAAALAFAVCAPPRGDAQDEEVSEERIKGAYLFGFASYVYWPAEVLADTGPFRIGVAGAPEVARRLAIEVVDDRFNDRRVDVVELESVDAIDDIDILFVGRGEAERLEAFLDAVEGRPVLTVTDFDDALERGSMVNFVIVNEYLKFEVSQAALRRSPLRLSADMLKIAVNVKNSTSSRRR